MNPKRVRPGVNALACPMCYSLLSRMDDAGTIFVPVSLNLFAALDTNLEQLEVKIKGTCGHTPTIAVYARS